MLSAAVVSAYVSLYWRLDEITLARKVLPVSDHAKLSLFLLVVPPAVFKAGDALVDIPTNSGMY